MPPSSALVDHACTDTCSILLFYVRSRWARLLQEHFATYPSTEVRSAGKQWTAGLYNKILYRVSLMVPAASTHLAWDMTCNNFCRDAVSGRFGCHSYSSQLPRGDPLADLLFLSNLYWNKKIISTTPDLGAGRVGRQRRGTEGWDEDICKQCLDPHTSCTPVLRECIWHLGTFQAALNFVSDIGSPIWTGQSMLMERTRSVWGTCSLRPDGQRRKNKNKRKNCEEKRQRKKFYISDR